ncbi:MAG: (d)CMP kinase [Candidatus Cryptobacteroides sp.]
MLMQVPDIIIAIDGYSSTGKSSFAKLIASELSFLYLDSGALYRAVTLYAIENNLITPSGEIKVEQLARALDSLDIHFVDKGEGFRTYIGDRCVEKQIRSLSVSAKVSPVSALPAVRTYVDERLREIGRSKRVVMDGRDIGTTVFPNAELKIFMTADPVTRAKRRMLELEGKGEKVEFAEVLKNLKERDYIDSHREVSPLTQAPDAIVLDNSDMTLKQQMEWVQDLIRKKFNLTQEA